MDQNRRTQRHFARTRHDEDALRSRLRPLAVNFPRYGYRLKELMLVRDSFSVNALPVQRLSRAEGLHMVRTKRRKPRRRRNPIVVQGEHQDQVWAIDFQFDENADGRAGKILNVIDELTREALATNATRRITTQGTMAVLDQVRQKRGT